MWTSSIILDWKMHLVWEGNIWENTLNVTDCLHSELFGVFVLSNSGSGSRLKSQYLRDPLTLLVGMQTSTATMENSVEIP